MARTYLLQARHLGGTPPQCPSRKNPASLAHVAICQRPHPVRGRREATAQAVISTISTDAKTTSRTNISPVPVTEELIQDLAATLCSTYYEYEYWVEDAWVEGKIPEQLCGTYFRNGPALQVENPRYPRRHHFDNDGMICKFAFRDGRCFFQNKFVRTEGFVAEQASGRPMFRNLFSKGSPDGGLLFNPFNLNFKNVANTCVVQLGGKLLALWEGGFPYELDPWTLETRGETDLGGTLPEPVTAHTRTITQPDGSERLVTISYEQRRPQGPEATFCEYAQDGRQLHRIAVPLPAAGMTLVHDFAVTEHYYVLMRNPMAVSVPKLLGEYLTGRTSFVECMEFDDKRRTDIFLVPRPGKGKAGGAAGKVRTVSIPACWAFHHANAFEAVGGRRLVLDSIVMPRVDLDAGAPPPPSYFRGKSGRSQLLRYTLDLDSGEVDTAVFGNRTLEFPSINPAFTGKAHRHIYLAGSTWDDPVQWGPLQVLAKVTIPQELGVTSPSAGVISSIAGQRDVTTQLWFPGPRCFVGEPIFVPKPGGTQEDDGWLLVPIEEGGERTHLAILDARYVQQGPVATIHLPHFLTQGMLNILDARDVQQGPVATIHLPHFLTQGLHGCWDSTFFGPATVSSPKWKEPNRIRAL